MGKKWVADYVYGLHKDDADAIYRSKEIFSEADRLLWANRIKATNKNRQIAAIADKFGVPYFDRVQLVCDDKIKVCSTFTNDGYKISYDYGHWTLDGAKFLGAKLVEQGFDNLVK